MYRRILVPVDGTDASRQALDQAIVVARVAGGSIRLLHVVDELEHMSGFETAATYFGEVRPGLTRRARQLLDAARARTASAGIPADVELAECMATRFADIVVERSDSWKADLIVMGTNGRRGVQSMLLGSDAEQVLRSANVPVLLVPARAARRQGAAACPSTEGAAPLSAP